MLERREDSAVLQPSPATKQGAQNWMFCAPARTRRFSWTTVPNRRSVSRVCSGGWHRAHPT